MKRTIWIVLSAILAASMLLTSCGTAKPTAAPVVVAPTTAPVVEPTAAPVVEPTAAVAARPDRHRHIPATDRRVFDHGHQAPGWLSTVRRSHQ